MCKATEPCRAVTPYGMVEGEKCSLRKEVNRLVTVEDFQSIAGKGRIDPSEQTKVVSFSSCPTQHYGGKVRLVFDTRDLKDKLEGMCYLPREKRAEYADVEKGMSDEAYAEGLKGEIWDVYNWVRAKYNVSLEMYGRECEYKSREPVSLDNLKRVEYWIGGIKARGDFSVSCEGMHPHQAGVYSRPENYVADIKVAREISEKLNVPFEVKSCFNSLRAGWGESIELTEENLKKLARGRIPEAKRREEVPETCKCS